MTRRAIVTLHDVAPATLEACLEVLHVLDGKGVDPVTLLVVPGTGWSGSRLDVLRTLAERHPLAGHGWSHRAPPPTTTYHRVHGAVLSRAEGEHLSRDRTELLGRVQRCAHWFEQVGLGTPDTYVPPAWALGRLTRSDLRALPFRYWETLTGIRDARTGTFRVLPLVGYQADTRLRAWGLRGLNAFNRAVAVGTRRPLRIAIHPQDLRLRLADELLRLLDGEWEYLAVPHAAGPGAEHGVPGGVS
ncbi:MAG: polysaccharide deacetylase family protein [Longimicrobiales bacterium]|nr:polysaccharide deacetylase family protein [Longimicrobiales bacterium]